MKNIGRALSTVGGERRHDGHIGPISSTGSGGKSMNVNNLNNSQLRGLMNILPYGISSRGMAGMRAQVIVNDDSNNTVVGVYDPNRPDVEVGEVLLYSIGSATIHLTKNGVIAVRTGIATLNIQSDGHIDIAGNVNINGTLSINGVQIG